MSGSANGFDPGLLAILVCPQTGTALEYDPAKRELISMEAGLAYPVEDGVPILLADRARKIKA